MIQPVGEPEQVDDERDDVGENQRDDTDIPGGVLEQQATSGAEYMRCRWRVEGLKQARRTAAGKERRQRHSSSDDHRINRP